MLEPLPLAITLVIRTRRIVPAGASVPGLMLLCTSLRRLMLKCSGSPSPHQNQSWRTASMVRFESTTSLTVPPSKFMNAMPRLAPVMTVLSIVTLRMAFMFPSENLMALEAEVRRQFVTVMFLHGNAGPNQFIE